MENNSQKAKSIILSKNEIVKTLDEYFVAGNIEHATGLLLNHIESIVMQNTDESEDSLSNNFAYTHKYIRESIQDLVGLSKFLLRLHIQHSDYKEATKA